MPVTLQADGIADLIKGTLNDLGRLKWSNISYDLQEYVAMSRLLKKERVQFSSGPGITRNLMVDKVDAARHVGLYASDQTNVKPIMETIEIPWRHSTVSYGFDYREITMNKGANEIFDLIKTRRVAATQSLAALGEETFWSRPTNSNDKLTPYGLFYWMVDSGTAGFEGQNPPGFTNVAGLDSSLTKYKNWRNYTDEYVAVTADDLIEKMWRAYTLTEFRAPVESPGYERGESRYGIYTTIDVLNKMRKFLETRNDNLGKDLALFGNSVTFMGTPVKWVPQLDKMQEQNNPMIKHPVVGVNWAVLYPVFLRDWNMKETGPITNGQAHNVAEVFVDMTWNLLCTDRRRLWLIRQQ